MVAKTMTIANVVIVNVSESFHTNGHTSSASQSLRHNNIIIDRNYV